MSESCSWSQRGASYRPGLWRPSLGIPGPPVTIFSLMVPEACRCLVRSWVLLTRRVPVRVGGPGWTGARLPGPPSIPRQDPQLRMMPWAGVQEKVMALQSCSPG